jgi:D-aminopeptidase
MEGDESLAVCIAKHEKRLAQLWYTQLIESEANEVAVENVDDRLRDLLPSWLHEEAGLVIHGSENVWEPWGGVRRMQSSLSKIHGCHVSQSNCR